MVAARILVVDDNPANLKLATHVLESDGYVVDQAASAEIALEQMRERIPDLILMDIELPGMDGLALTRILKADSATQGIPVIALTAFAMKGDEQKARDAGCDGYVTKPLSTRTLSAQIAGFLPAKKREASIKILVVEDVPSDLKLARVVLTSAGYEVREAATAEKALAAIRENPPELILLDLKLPGIHGLDLIRQLKQERTTENIPIVAVTSYPDEWTQQEALEAGCAAYIVKPIDTKQFVQQIADVASGR